MRVYPHYRDSGVEWLGGVPTHWRVKRLKVVASTNDEALSDAEDPLRVMFYVDISAVDATRGITRYEELVFEDAPSRARRLVRDGDTIVSTVRTYLRAIAPIDSPKPEMVVSTGFAVIRPRAIDDEFASWVLREQGFLDEIVARSVGVSYPAINAPEIGNLPVAIPPHDEQRAIAAFLDRETERIDSLIAKKRLLMERLREYRTALITRTVTRGLPPAAARAAGLEPSPRLKPSGVEWLGEMPEHWEVLHPSFGFGRIGSGTTPRSDAEEYYRGDTPWVTTSELRESTIFETAKSVTAAALHDHTALHVYPPGALVIAMYGATIGRLGILGVPAAVNQACCVFAEPTRLRARFVYYWLAGFRDVLISHSVGGGQPNLSQEDLRGLRIPAPSTDEQDRIAEYLDTEISLLNGLASEIDSGIERLQEYRTALITAAVTGKIDVRESATTAEGSAELPA